MTSALCAVSAMAMNRVSLQPAWILHRKPYRNTSALVEAFTRDHGRVGLVARGVSGPRSRWQALLQPFRPLLLSWQGRGELYTLTDAEPDGATPELSGRQVLAAFYVNELLLRLTQRADALSGVFELYRHSLAVLSEQDAESALRGFERDLLRELGYGLVLSHEADSDVPIAADGLYRYVAELGPVRLAAGANLEGAVHGRTLLELASGTLTDTESRREAKRLMREVLSFYLGDRPLKTRALHWPRRGGPVTRH